MINYVIGLLLLLCMGMGVRPPVNKPTPLPVKEVSIEKLEPISVETSKKVFLTVTKCDNCSVLEFDRIKTAAAQTNKVISSQCFRDAIVSLPLIQTNGRSPLQVVEHLLSSEVKIETEMYWTISRVLGYTLEGVNKEWINRRYMMKWGVCDLSSLLGHETGHKIGYDHDYKPTQRRPNSVPYAINKAFSACCKLIK